MAASTAELLRENLTEYGLVRILAREDIPPELVRNLPVEESARAVQRSMRTLTTGSRAKKSAKKVRKVAKKSCGYPRAPKPSKKNKTPPQPNYWVRVKKEIHILICTNDKKYAALRTQISKHGALTQTVIVSNIATAVAVSLGLSLAAIVPFVAIALIGLVRVGANAWCAGTS